MKKSLILSFLAVAALLLTACATTTPEPAPIPTATPGPVEEAMEETMKSIADIAVEDGRFTTLVAALDAAGLVETFAGEGAFTVFAPTDDAFAMLPEGTVEALLEDIPQLTNILLYHAVDGEVLAETVVDLESATTLLGKDVQIAFQDGAVILNGEVQVIITDIEASNSVIHVVDAVLLPPAEEAMDEEMMQSIVDIAIEDGRFTTLVTALQAAELAGTLAGEGAFTVFAPTDDAFTKLPEGTVEALLEDIPQLTNILLYHVVEGKVLAEQVVGLDSATTLFGDDIQIAIEDGAVILNGEVQVIITDIEASNGVIHVLDAVLLTPA